MSPSTLSDRKPSGKTITSAAENRCSPPGFHQQGGNLKVSRAEKWLARRMLQAIGNPPIAMVLCDGDVLSASADCPSARVIIHDRAMLLKIAVDPLVNFGEGYSEGRIDLEGSLEELMDVVYRHLPKRRSPGLARRVMMKAEDLLSGNTLHGSRTNIHHHYDIGNDFYRLWLDRELLYTCAYYPTPDATLEAAQRAKMDYVCRKLRLRPGETVVEAGCGWGALARYMARHYGAKVRAYNISHEQIVHARRQAADEGLGGQVEFIEGDYRTITGKYDAFVSVGMLEHVGPGHYHELAGVMDRTLGDRGRGLIHSIGQVHPGKRLNKWIRRRIFPGAYPPALSEIVRIVENAGFSVLDAENLRLHYAKTLEHWLTRFEASAGQIRQRFDERFVRMWRLYLAGSLASFATGALHLFQVVFARPACNEIPWTRDYLYED